jgi:hypothetical protein
MLHWLAICVLTAVLWTVLAARLKQSGYPDAWAIACGAAAVVQPAFLQPAFAAQCLLFSAFSYALASAVLGFAEQQDPRRIILLGGSLAGAQILSPVNGLLFAASIPFVLGYSKAGHKNSSTTGLVVLLLFLPALAALALLWPRAGQDLAILRPALPSRSLSGGAALAPPLALLALLPSLVFAAMQNPTRARIVGGIAYVLCAGALVSQFFDAGDFSNAILTSTGPLIVLLIAGLPVGAARLRDASLCAASGVALSWAVGLGMRFL